MFCTGESTFDFSAIDQGKIILTTLPQKFQTERRYVNTFLKLLFYNHALRRFDKCKANRAKDNVLAAPPMAIASHTRCLITQV